MTNIGLSIVKGSGIGPTLWACSEIRSRVLRSTLERISEHAHYIVMKSDLHVVSRTNEIIKFADDTTILVPENTDVGLDVEFRHVSKWADF